ncbi:MAG: NUDIX hydrolase [Pseudomonadota bacterium]
MNDDAFELIGPWPADFTIAGVIALIRDRRGRILIQLRDNDAPRAPGVWGFFGGAVEEGETLPEAMRRELFEELGVDVSEDELAPKWRIYRPVTGFRMYMFEVSRTISPEEIRLGEGAGFAFIEPEDAGKFALFDLTEILLAKLGEDV